jgi:hypothetical protein
MLSKITLFFNKDKQVLINILRQLSEEQLPLFESLIDIKHPLGKKHNVYFFYKKRRYIGNDLLLPVFLEFFYICAKISKINPYKDDNPLFIQIMTILRESDLGGGVTYISFKLETLI